MYYVPFMYPCPYYVNVPYNYGRPPVYWTFPNEIEYANRFDSFSFSDGVGSISLTDYGSEPFVVNINEATKWF